MRKEGCKMKHYIAEVMANTFVVVNRVVEEELEATRCYDLEQDGARAMLTEFLQTEGIEVSMDAYTRDLIAGKVEKELVITHEGSSITFEGGNLSENITFDCSTYKGTLGLFQWWGQYTFFEPKRSIKADIKTMKILDATMKLVSQNYELVSEFAGYEDRIEEDDDLTIEEDQICDEYYEGCGINE